MVIRAIGHSPMARFFGGAINRHYPSNGYVPRLSL
jgi:hypothetical protein